VARRQAVLAAGILPLTMLVCRSCYYLKCCCSTAGEALCCRLLHRVTACASHSRAPSGSMDHLAAVVLCKGCSAAVCLWRRRTLSFLSTAGSRGPGPGGLPAGSGHGARSSRCRACESFYFLHRQHETHRWLQPHHDDAPAVTGSSSPTCTACECLSVPQPETVQHDNSQGAHKATRLTRHATSTHAEVPTVLHVGAALMP
jgi:hypothetical protein